MSEEEFAAPQESAEEPGEERSTLRTGVEAVDAVVAAVDGLTGTPIDEHAQVFGAAHDALRRALDVDQDA